MKKGGISIKIPYEVSIGINITLMVIITLAVVINNDRLKSSFLKDYYLYIYMGYMLNLLNMVGFKIYYNKKINTMVGNSGRVGSKGKKGRRGKTVTCSYCAYNIYFFKTKKYNRALSLNIGLEENDKTLTNKIKSFGFYGSGLEMEELDLSFLTKLHSQSKKDKIIGVLRDIFKFSTRMSFLSYSLNKSIKGDDFANKITFLNPIGSNGYYPLGNSVVNDDLANKLNAFLVNGDINYPRDYKILFSIQNNDILERQGTEANKEVVMNYSFIKLIPKEGYVSLGEVVVRNQDLKPISKDSNLAVCIKKSCAKQIDISLLKFMAVKISYKSDDDKINRILNYSNNNNNRTNDNANSLTYKIKKKDYESVISNETLDIYSIWKTPINTYVTNSIIGNNNIISGTIGMNILGNNKKYISSNGININEKGESFLDNTLKNIHIPKIIRIIYVMMNQYTLFFETIAYILTNFIDDFNYELTKLNKKLTTIITQKQKKELLFKVADINNKITLFNKIITNVNSKDVFTDFDSLFDSETQDILHNNLPDFNKTKQLLVAIPTLIDTKTTLYDLLLLVCPDGYNTIIIMDKEPDVSTTGVIPNKLQLELLKLCKICFPPNTKIYIPKNECMAFNKIDLERRNNISKLDTILIEFENFLMNYPIIDNDNEDSICKDDDTICVSVLKYIHDIEQIINDELSHIADYKNKIRTRDFEEFGNGRIIFLIEQYSKINDYITHNYLIYIKKNDDD